MLITEDTTLSRPGQPVVTERAVEQQAAALMGENKYAFLLCSSTNIDRLAVFFAAAQKTGRLFVCDSYQKSVLDVVTRYGKERSPLYDFSRALTYGENLLPRMEEKGFCMPIRTGPWARSFAARFNPERSLLVYSMWEGYLERDPELKDFVESRTWTTLHASGHGLPQQIKAVCDVVQPRLGVIPIHTQAPERLAEAIAPFPAIPLPDETVYEL